jgi:hypothetical protein
MNAQLFSGNCWKDRVTWAQLGRQTFPGKCKLSRERGHPRREDKLACSLTRACCNEGHQAGRFRELLGGRRGKQGCVNSLGLGLDPKSSGKPLKLGKNVILSKTFAKKMDFKFHTCHNDFLFFIFRSRKAEDDGICVYFQG